MACKVLASRQGGKKKAFCRVFIGNKGHREARGLRRDGRRRPEMQGLILCCTTWTFFIPVWLRCRAWTTHGIPTKRNRIRTSTGAALDDELAYLYRSSCSSPHVSSSLAHDQLPKYTGAPIRLAQDVTSFLLRFLLPTTLQGMLAEFFTGSSKEVGI